MYDHSYIITVLPMLIKVFCLFYKKKERKEEKHLEFRKCKIYILLLSYSIFHSNRVAYFVMESLSTYENTTVLEWNILSHNNRM